MKDVAHRANVSISTVSYVLNNSGPVAADRRSRVLEAVRALKYTPNGSARNLKRRSASTIGLVVPDLANQFFALVAQGVERGASARDVLVVLCAPEQAAESESVNARLLRSQRLDGVIYLSSAATSAACLLELSRGGPVVLVDEQVHSFDLPAVVADGRRGAREIACHVLDQGHRRVAIIGGPPGLWTSQQRLAGYREALAAAGINPDTVPVLAGDYRQRSGYESAARALDAPAGDRPTALLCANDLMAVGAMEYCKSVGIGIPEEVSIVGFDDVPFAQLLTPRLTTVRQPAEDMGFRAVAVLFDILENKTVSAGDAVFPVAVQIRNSVAPPPSDT